MLRKGPMNFSPISTAGQYPAFVQGRGRVELEVRYQQPLVGIAGLHLFSGEHGLFDRRNLLVFLTSYPGP